jgi:hypothetical protein
MAQDPALLKLPVGLDPAMPKIFGIRWGLRASKAKELSLEPSAGLDQERQAGEEDGQFIPETGPEHPQAVETQEIEQSLSERPSIIEEAEEGLDEPTEEEIYEAVDATLDEIEVELAPKRGARKDVPLVTLVSAEVDLTIERLSQVSFKPDPLAGRHFSRMVSLFSSAYKRHGFILESAILKRLSQNPNFTVWNDQAFYVSPEADRLVARLLASPETAIEQSVGYAEKGRTLQIDAIVWDKRRRTVAAYEIKRGHGAHDSGKRRSILRDLLCVQVLLKGYAESRGHKVKEAHSRIIFYYGNCSIPKPFSLTKDELDDHFGMPILSHVEEVNLHFRRRLFEILSDE